MWQLPTTVNNLLFQITCGAGSIIDVDVDLILTDAVNQTGMPVAACGLGVQYYLALDNGGSGLNNFPPVALFTTA